MAFLFYPKVSFGIPISFVFVSGFCFNLKAAMKQQNEHLIWRACCIALHSNLKSNNNVLTKALIVFPTTTGYYYNSTGLLACEPFFSKPSYRILASCAFYFPTTMVLMYCYGSSFHANRFRLASMQSGLAVPAAITEKVNHFEICLFEFKTDLRAFHKNIMQFVGEFSSPLFQTRYTTELSSITFIQSFVIVAI